MTVTSAAVCILLNVNAGQNKSKGTFYVSICFKNVHGLYIFCTHTDRKSNFIPRNGDAWPRSQHLLHSSICERFIYSLWSAYLAAAKYAD
jgi:hypothetical protein